MTYYYRYVLDKSSKQFICPNPECGQKRFKRYVDTITNLYLPDRYGKCNRSNNCRYHLNPYKDGYGKEEGKVYSYISTHPKVRQQQYYIPEVVLNTTLNVEAYSNNIFVQNLLKLCPTHEIEKVISLYRIGTIEKGEREGAVTFPFINKTGNICTIQAKQFDEANNTLKNGTDFLHSILVRHYSRFGKTLPDWLNNYIKNEKFVTCLFGEHLLSKYPLNPVALVEAPKTAIIATLYFGLPDNPKALLWLAVYNKSSLTLEKCKVLQGRKLILYPDLNAYDEWSIKTLELKSKLDATQIVISDLLERNSNDNEKRQGLDLADYITKFDYKEIRQQMEV